MTTLTGKRTKGTFRATILAGKCTANLPLLTCWISLANIAMKTPIASKSTPTA